MAGEDSNTGPTNQTLTLSPLCKFFMSLLLTISADTLDAILEDSNTINTPFSSFLSIVPIFALSSVKFPLTFLLAHGPS
ncbi:hypothetical protein [Bacillus sp. TL12]|uniref:hypothetical protein n=1 Tax=Bacillus sp. TL12 TaxID=2894756 RepID=UPI001F523275|nr:hypothetical protein [Bacillus sp. TL12]MCI0768582.1 hypothetical protein [Bacillus sp. TL12]